MSILPFLSKRSHVTNRQSIRAVYLRKWLLVLKITAEDHSLLIYFPLVRGMRDAQTSTGNELDSFPPNPSPADFRPVCCRLQGPFSVEFSDFNISNRFVSPSSKGARHKIFYCLPHFRTSAG